MMSTASTKVLACARRWIAPLLLGVLPLVVLAQNLLPVPALGARVIDPDGHV
jgi:hypothetical protein